MEIVTAASFDEAVELVYESPESFSAAFIDYQFEVDGVKHKPGWSV